jgi:hypothetical protein
MSMQLLNRKKADKPEDGKFKPVPSRSKRTRSYGVDVDGAVIRVVEMLDDAVVSYSTYQGETTLDAFQQFLATKPSGPVTVAWMTINLHIRRVPLPTVPPIAMRAAILDAVDENLPLSPGSAIVAARLFSEGEHQSAAVAAVDGEALSGVWSQLPHHGLQLVPAPLLLSQDGLFLGIRNNDAHLLLVNGGAITAARPLTVGGLVTVYDRLGEDRGASLERFSTVTRGGTRLDPEAATTVDTYGGEVGDEVRRTVDYWARQGFTVPSEIFVYGPGIVLPNLSGKLLDAALFAKPVAMPAVSVDAIARNERPSAYLALHAAMYDPGEQPVASLPNPAAAERDRKRLDKARTVRKLSIAGVGAALVIAACSYLVISPKGDLSSAQDALKKKQIELKGAQSALDLDKLVKSGNSALGKVTAVEPKWEFLVQQIVATAPANTEIASLAFNQVGDQVTVTFSAKVGVQPQATTLDFRQSVQEWLQRLNDAGATYAVAPVLKKVDPNGATQGAYVDVSLVVKVPLVGEFLANRSIGVTK